ncbi:AMP-binding protein [Gehongia tenuis]|uniref:AMP-binding protein n=1 Tax=Gehongia tenuis TaxID=2763655 RepID=A0A926D3A0_9FIRM|nr:AMP-binding protein [Gehongia tenuis]MBC8530503.1 AMP-binding protein [Gehongia tenuis]
MPLYEKFLGRSRDDFASLEDLNRNYKVHIHDDFNYGFDVIDVLAEEKPDGLAMMWVGADGEERRFTFRDMSLLSNKAANFFAAKGVKKGDMVMLVLKRGYQFWYTLLGLHKLGAVAIPATHLLTAKDYVYRCNAASVKMLVVTGDNDVTEHVDEALPKCETVELRAVTKGKEVPGWIDYDAELAGMSDVFPRPEGEGKTWAKDMMLMFFTSGTTGYPKMVWHDYTYPLGHLLTGCFWHRVEENGLHFTISDTGWGKALWGKIYGQWLGESAVFTYDFEKFSAPDILGKMEKYRVTTFCAPPTMYRYMIKEDLAKYDLSALRHCTTAGEALNPEVYSQWKNKTGLKIFEGFGQTETTLCCWTAFPWMQPRLGSMGLPAPGWRLTVVDPEGRECPAGVTGEICVRTDEAGGGKPFGLFSGYFRDDELTKKSWHDDLYHTGDTAYKDELGFLWYVGRIDDVIKSSGYRIGPFEVESALMEHPSVLECAVTGVPDPVRGFVVKATVVLAQGYGGSEALTKELQNHVKHSTAPYKYPRIIEYVEELPKTISGKIRRVEIRENDQKKQ